MSCGKLLAPGQWWHFCGETDMGQTLPVKCTACGGEYKLASPEAQAEHDRKKAEWAAKPSEGKFFGTYLGTGASKPIEHSLGWEPAFLLVKQRDGNHKVVDNPEYVEPPPSAPEEKDEPEAVGAWVIRSGPYFATHLLCLQKPAWWRRALVKMATGWTWEDQK